LLVVRIVRSRSGLNAKRAVNQRVPPRAAYRKQARMMRRQAANVVRKENRAVLVKRYPAEPVTDVSRTGDERSGHRTVVSQVRFGRFAAAIRYAGDRCGRARRSISKAC